MALPAVSLFEQRAPAPRVPDVADHTAARVASAALLAHAESGRRELERAVSSLEAIDTVLLASEEAPTGLLPAARDLANASLDDHRAYRRAADALLDRGGLDPALEERIEQFRGDDPLALARARIRDARQIEFARAFNALAEPAGRSAMNLSMAPYRFAQALVAYAIQRYQTEALPLQRRQALAHQKDYLARYPDDPAAEVLRSEIAGGQAAWNQTQRDRMLAQARRALAAEEPRLALVYADRALRYLPEDEAASELRDEAEERLLAEREARERSVSAAPEAGVAAPEAQALAVALLAGGDVGAESRALLERADAGPLADEARFALALSQAESGQELASWQGLESLAALDTRESNMARHADRLVRDPAANPYGAFRSAVRTARSQRARFALLGPWADGPPERGLPELLEWPLGVPALMQVVTGAPLRLLQLPWLPSTPADAAAARAARSYLRHHPDGARAEELCDWLVEFESGRQNWLAVLALEQQRRAPEDPLLAPLREQAARQSLEVASREVRGGLRLAMLQRVAQEFPGTEAGDAAGHLARAQLERATPQQIRVSRGFLEENPEVAGIAGLGLQPSLLDGDRSNGELHPAGVAFLGGREIELSLLAPGGDEDAAPALRRELLDEAHLARAVALLEETSFRNSLVDSDAALVPDAKRDRFFEQARLGAAEVLDPRPDAVSSYSYQGMRERYGLVRSRESILPFDLVLQGSLGDLSLGAFPRMREPRETPDAILYR